MSTLGKSYLSERIAEIQSTMALSFPETLQQERARLLCTAANFSALSRSDADFAEVFTAVKNLRQSIAENTARRADEFSKDELIHLQSSLYAVVDEQLLAVIEQRFKQQTEKVTRLAECDPLTQLPNRAAFERRLQDEALRARRYGREFSLVMFDVDGLKSVNDRFGHRAGDQLLAGIARQMQLSLRQSDAVFRYGGDEFVALCPETSRQAMETVLRRLEGNLLADCATAGLAESIGVSWGVASFPADAADIDELIGLADKRLYDCKKEHHQRAAACA